MSSSSAATRPTRPSNEVAHAALRVTVASNDPARLGRLFSAKITELGLATIPGNTGRGGGGFNGAQTIVHWPALIDSAPRHRARAP